MYKILNLKQAYTCHIFSAYKFLFFMYLWTILIRTENRSQITNTKLNPNLNLNPNSKLNQDS